MPETNVDAFLEIIDSKGAAIAGESLDKQHPNLLQIANFSFGTEMAHSASTGTGLGAGKVSLKTFTFEVSNSKASPVLMKYCCSGDHCQKATLYVRKAGSGQQDYYIWTFKELLITGFELNCSVDIVEKVTFAYTGIHCEYRQQDQKGQVSKSGVKGGWDIKKNDELTI
jgi:type VI secretion system secreted protein Hcp